MDANFIMTKDEALEAFQSIVGFSVESQLDRKLVLGVFQSNSKGKKGKLRSR